VIWRDGGRVRGPAPAQAGCDHDLLPAPDFED
jgi:hypothetical protein